MTDEEKRNCPSRRTCDHQDDPSWGDGHGTPCPNLIVHTTVQEQLLVDMHEMKAIMESNSKMLLEIKEMVTAWKNIKGFIKTLSIIGVVAKWCTVIVAGIVAVTYFNDHK